MNLQFHNLTSKNSSQVGSALTETKNWDLLVDCISRDGWKILDPGVDLFDKHTLLMKTHTPFQAQCNILHRIRLCCIINFLKCFG
jgi:uncharacterized protein YjhX (UPF0386 family)